MSKIQLLAVGYPGFDRIMRTSRVTQVGETGIILDPPGLPEPTPGGCANNIAVAAARLGVGAAPVIVLGNDADGFRLKEMLAAEGVNTTCVHQVLSGKTAGTFLFVDPESGHQTFYFPGAADEPIELTIPDALLTDLRYGVITVGSQTHTKQFVEKMAAAGVPLVWSLRNDPHAFPRDLVENLIHACAILVMNEYEAAQLIDVLDLSGIETLFDIGVETIVLTLGAKGSRIVQRHRTLEIPVVPPDAVVDPTGAGDAFVGGLLSGICLGADITTAARMGAVTASFVLEAWGCQTNLPNLARVKTRYAKAFGEELILKGGA